MNLEGVWVESYRIYPENTIDTGKVRPDYAHFLHIKGDALRIKNFERNVNRTMMIDTTLNFTLKNDLIIFEGDSITWSNVKVYEDSMFITFNNYELIHVKYIKLPKQSKKSDWNPAGKRYKAKVTGETYYHHYTNDSLMHLYLTEGNSTLKNNWQIENVDNYSFLLLESFFESTPLLIDSISDTKVYVTDHSLEKETLIFEEQSNTAKKPDLLVGTWKLVSKEEDTDETEQFLGPFSKNNLHQIQITKDSFTIFYMPFIKSTNKWTYFSDENTLLLEKEEKMVKLVDVTKDTLVLEMNLDKHNYNSKKFVFTRKE
ncbi:hypothetical protein [Kordia algicida]|uniref:hypothetical protein n=1 Tax=Kordia algicida TaxID=221066 RepID=UPI00058BEC22|nr:hypothetical protein [Kordia algicida]